MKAVSQKHLFSLYYPALRNQKGSWILTDELLIHRIVRVLRFETRDEFILFNEEMNATVKIASIEKHSVTVDTINEKKNYEFKPHISALIPILKRESLEEAIYNAVECGTNEIQLIITEKNQRAWGGSKELERLQKICIAAAEQSKNFALPHIKIPKTFNEMIETAQKSVLIFFDAQGESLSHSVKKIHEQNHHYIFVVFGPEADFSPSEKVMLKKLDAYFTKLTPTILRSQQAIAVGIGAIRSLLAEDTQ